MTRSSNPLGRSRPKDYYEYSRRRADGAARRFESSGTLRDTGGHVPADHKVRLTDYATTGG
jgi:hypothetical protein